MEENEALDASKIERIEDPPSPLSQSQQKLRGRTQTKEKIEAEIANLRVPRQKQKEKCYRGTLEA